MVYLSLNISIDRNLSQKPMRQTELMNFYVKVGSMQSLARQVLDCKSHELVCLTELMDLWEKEES